MKIFAHFDIFW